MTVFIYCLLYSLVLFVSVALSFKLGELICPIFEKHYASNLKKEVDEFFKWVLSSENHSHDLQEVYRFSVNLTKDSMSNDNHSYRKCMIDVKQGYDEYGIGFFTKFSIRSDAKDASLLNYCSRFSDVKTRYYGEGHSPLLSCRKSLCGSARLHSAFVESKLIISPLVLHYFIDKTIEFYNSNLKNSTCEDVNELENEIDDAVIQNFVLKLASLNINPLKMDKIELQRRIDEEFEQTEDYKITVK